MENDFNEKEDIQGQTALGMDDNDALTEKDAPSVSSGSLRGSMRGFPKRLLSVNMKAKFFKL